MKGKILAICTQEPEYARGLSEYILGRRELLFQVMVFLDLEKLRQFINEHRVDLLLLDDIYAETETMDVKQVFMLCDIVAAGCMICLMIGIVKKQIAIIQFINIKVERRLLQKF